MFNKSLLQKKAKFQFASTSTEGKRQMIITLSMKIKPRGLSTKQIIKK